MVIDKDTFEWCGDYFFDDIYQQVAEKLGDIESGPEKTPEQYAEFLEAYMMLDDVDRNENDRVEYMHDLEDTEPYDDYWDDKSDSPAQRKVNRSEDDIEEQATMQYPPEFFEDILNDNGIYLDMNRYTGKYEFHNQDEHNAWIQEPYNAIKEAVDNAKDSNVIILPFHCNDYIVSDEIRKMGAEKQIDYYIMPGPVDKFEGKNINAELRVVNKSLFGLRTMHVPDEWVQNPPEGCTSIDALSVEEFQKSGKNFAYGWIGFNSVENAEKASKQLGKRIERDSVIDGDSGLHAHQDNVKETVKSSVKKEEPSIE